MTTDPSPRPDDDGEQTIYGDAPGSEAAGSEPDRGPGQRCEEPSEDVNDTIYHDSGEEEA